MTSKIIPSSFQIWKSLHSALPPSTTDWIPSVAPAFSARLFGPLAFSGFGHSSSRRFFRAPSYPWYKVKCAKEDLWGAVTKAIEGERAKELRWEGKILGEAWTGGSQPSTKKFVGHWF